MPELLSFFVILLAGLVFSGVFRRIHIPWVIALIAAGIIIGPYGFGWFVSNTTIDFLGKIGLVFLMFIAGLNTRLSGLGEVWGHVWKIALLNGLIPFLAGIGIGIAFDYPLIPSLLLGIVFVSSSVAVVVPSLEAAGLIHSSLGRTIVATAVLEDIGSLLLLSVLLHTIDPAVPIPFPVFIVFLFLFLLILVGLKWLLPKLRWLFGFARQNISATFEEELRLAMAVLIGTVVFFELIGLHAIVAGFFAGLILSEIVRSDMLKGKIHALGYGVFIPIFFVLVGVETNLRIFLEVNQALFLTAAVVGGSVLAKFASGWLGGKLGGLSARESGLVGGSTVPQLSTTLAVAFTARQLELFEPQLVTTLIMLSVLTTLGGPLLIRRFLPERQGPMVSEPNP